MTDHEIKMANRACPQMQTVVLDTVRVIHQTTVDAHMMKWLSEPDRMQMLADQDAYARRHILSAFGKTKVYEVSTPATWWQHFKLALRKRWPRLFGRFRVRLLTTTIDTGVVVADIPEPVRSRHRVIPYTLGPSWPATREDM